MKNTLIKKYFAVVAYMLFLVSDSFHFNYYLLNKLNMKILIIAEIDENNLQNEHPDSSILGAVENELGWIDRTLTPIQISELKDLPANDATLGAEIRSVLNS